MRHVARVGMVLAVLFAGIVLPGSAAQACRCAVLGPEALTAAADAVFYGEIVDRTPTRPDNEGSSSSLTGRTYTIDVDQVFKGRVYAEQTLLAGGSSSSCGLTLPESGSVLVYATSVSNNQAPGVQYATSLCAGTQMRDSVPAVLGEGDPPIASELSAYGSELTITPDADEDTDAVPIVVGGVAVVLAGWPDGAGPRDVAAASERRSTA